MQTLEKAFYSGYAQKISNLSFFIKITDKDDR
jgi:hypothetical protein